MAGKRVSQASPTSKRGSQAAPLLGSATLAPAPAPGTAVSASALAAALAGVDSDESSEEFQPAPQDARIEDALAVMDVPMGSSAAVPCLTGRWMIHQDPAPCETGRYVVDLRSSGKSVEGTAEVAQLRDTTQVYSVDIRGTVVAGPVIQLKQTLVQQNPPRGASARQWVGHCHIFVDESNRYFSGTYQSGTTTGIISGALTPETFVMDSVRSRKWPPPPVKREDVMPAATTPRQADAEGSAPESTDGHLAGAEEPPCAEEADAGEDPDGGADDAQPPEEPEI